MKEDFIIEGVRGSVFMPQITLEWSFVSALQEVLPNYIPSVGSDVPQMIKGLLLTPGDWLLTSPDGNIKVVFQSQKIDYIFKFNKNYSKQEIEGFSNQCIKVFEKIMGITGLKASRLAIAPTFRYEGGFSSLINFVNTVYAKNNFKNSNVDNCDFSQVFRIDEDINEKTIKINYLSKFHVEPLMTSNNGVNIFKDVTLIDLDINTFVNPNYSFDISDLDDFFNKAPNFCEIFLSWYFDK